MVAQYVRQAVVIVHGMGEQSPLDMLSGFIDAGLPQVDGKRYYYSRPDKVTDSYEARRYLAPRQPAITDPGDEIYAQTEYFEYHWAHLMTGNRLDDLWPVFSRMMLQPPKRVPSGLRVVWALFWLILIGVVLMFTIGPWEFAWAEGGLEQILTLIVGTGVVGAALMYVVTKWVPGWIQASFVDVVRYLDTSPRSYAQRHDIRKGMVDLLRELHRKRYQRIIVVAHSLGAYIAYDGITSLWAEMNQGTRQPTTTDVDPGTQPDGLADLEQAASVLVPGQEWPSEYATPSSGDVAVYQDAQRELWLGLRRNMNMWKITDFISVGTPMYMADELFTHSRREFNERVDRSELAVCPPRDDGDRANNDVNGTERYYSWNRNGIRVLHHAAPFAVTRWTNLWFPARWGFFGDWFGGPMERLFGPGIKDVKLTKDGWQSKIPGGAHSAYFRVVSDNDNNPPPDAVGSARQELRRAMDLASSSWLTETVSLEP